MALRLIIARHGNTFESGETPRRVGGGRTDLPLTAHGRDQARSLGRDLSTKFGPIDKIYAAPLLRTTQTAEIAASEMASSDIAPPPAIETLDFLREIDHGPDENKSDAEIADRLGPQALKLWDTELTMPADWAPRPVEILKSWQLFLNRVIQDYEDACRTHPRVSALAPIPDQTILVVTSNGIARFAPPAVLSTLSLPSLKLATAAYGVMSYDDAKWTLINWNHRPS